MFVLQQEALEDEGLVRLEDTTVLPAAPQNRGKKFIYPLKASEASKQKRKATFVEVPMESPVAKKSKKK